MASQLQKQVEKQKHEAERKFSSWFINKFKKNKTQYIREQDERSAEAERLRKQKKPSSASLTASGSSSALSHSSSATSKGDGAGMQRQQSFLRAQLLEMKRHSHEVLLHAKSRGEDHSSDEEYDEVHSVLGEDDGDEHSNNNANASALQRPKSRTRMRRSLTASSDGNQSDPNQTDDEDEEKKGNDTDDEDSHRGSLRNSFTSTGGGGGSQRNSFTGGGGSGSQRNSISEEFERRSSRATLLYEEAISALEEVLHPETRMRRSDSATKRLFDKPENEWI